jgi:hypothetical protein
MAINKSKSNDHSPSESSAETGLRLAKEYWLRTIRPRIAGRKLRDKELFVAADAHRRLQASQREAEDWNKTAKGKALPVPAAALAELDQDRFRGPEELYRDEHLKPELLAAIAAALLNKCPAELTPAEAVSGAHELLMAAERYIMALPEQKRGIGRVLETFSEVTFAEIEASNGQFAAGVPFLPPAPYTLERNHSGKKKEPHNLSGPAIKAAVKGFLEEKKRRRPTITEKECRSENVQTAAMVRDGQAVTSGNGNSQSYEEWLRAPDEEIKHCLENSRISLQHLCELRWTRFKDFWEKQGQRARNRKPEANKPKRPQTRVPASAGTSPVKAGKRER